jgi:hypothetical protein
MIPQPGSVLTDLAVKLAMSIAPETTSSFAMANTGLISMLMLSLAQDSERAVANRMADIEDMKTLFRSNDAQPAPGVDLRGAYCESAPTGLHLTEMDVYHAEGLNLLIDLQAWAELHSPPLDEAIWQFLRAHTERNRFDLPDL